VPIFFLLVQKENGQKVPLYGIPQIIAFNGCGKKGRSRQSRDNPSFHLPSPQAVDFGSPAAVPSLSEVLMSRNHNARQICPRTPPSISVACAPLGCGMCGGGKWAEPKSWPAGWQAMVCVEFLAHLYSTMESLAPVGRQEFRVALEGNHRRAFDFGKFSFLPLFFWKRKAAPETLADVRAN
jgi:hypothetical protein